MNRTHFRRLTTLAVLAVVLYVAIDKRSWWSDLRQLSVSGFVSISVVSVSLWVVGGFIFRSLYRPLGLPLALGESTALAMATSLGNYLPFVQGGAILRGLYLKRKYGLRYSQFASSLGSMYLVNLLTYSVAGLLALGWVYFVEDTFSWEVTLGLVGILAAAGLFYLLTTLPWSHRLLATLHLERFLEASLILHRDRRFFFEVMAANAVAILLQATQLYLAYSSLGYRVSFMYCLITIPFTIFVSMIGIAPGGLGLTEAVIAFTSSALGYGLQQGAVSAILMRAVSLLWLLPLGGLSLYFLSRSESRVHAKVNERSLPSEESAVSDGHMKNLLSRSLKLSLRREFTLATRFKIFLRLTMPGLYSTALRKWSRNNRRLARISEAFVERHGLVVLDGPFAGMAYVPCPVNITLVPKLLGCYEAELHGVLARVLDTDYAEIVNIGCSEGYYAIGLALRLPGARVHAFDIDPVARQLCKDMARANGVTDRVIVSGACDIERLHTLPLEQALIICDCEGCELDLLRPDLVPGLRACDLLVELHDLLDPSLSRTILARFAATHDITLLSSIERDPEAYPVLSIFNAKDQCLAVAEFRPGVMQWAFMTSRIAHLQKRSSSMGVEAEGLA